MRTLLNTSFAVILGAALLGAPAMAAPANPASAPLGVVVQAEKAQVGADTTAGGATIYDGDLLQTDWGGLLRANFSGPQIYLRARSSAQVHGMPNGFSADLTSGTVDVSSKGNQTFEVLADGASIRPSGTDPVVAQVTRVGSNELLISSTRGVLKVTMGDEVKTVESGGSYRMDVEADPSSSSDPGPQGPYHTARNRFIWIAIAGVSAATAVGVWRALVSPSNP